MKWISGAVQTGLALIAVAFVIGAISACGGNSEAAPDSPEETARVFAQAVVDGDGKTACGLFSKAGIEEITKQGNPPCAQQLEQAVGEISDADRDRVESATYELSRESDGKYTVIATDGEGNTRRIQIVEEDGEYKIVP